VARAAEGGAVEWNGMGWGGVEWSGVEWNGVGCGAAREWLVTGGRAFADLCGARRSHGEPRERPEFRGGRGDRGRRRGIGDKVWYVTKPMGGEVGEGAGGLAGWESDGGRLPWTTVVCPALPARRLPLGLACV
jgi:hypothetical protein